MPAGKEPNFTIFDDIWSTVDEEKQNKSTEESSVDESDEEADIDKVLLTIQNTPSPEKVKKKCGKAIAEKKISPRNAVNLTTLSKSTNFLENKNLSEKLNIHQSNSVINNETKIPKINNSNDSIDSQKSKEKSDVCSTSFSDTFDLLSDLEKVDSKIPEELPLFADTEPTHFNQPPKSIYNKRKRAFKSIASFKKSDSGNDSSNSNVNKKEKKNKKPKTKKKKEKKLQSEDDKNMQKWIESMNKTFEEVNGFDLIVE